MGNNLSSAPSDFLAIFQNSNEKNKNSLIDKVGKIDRSSSLVDEMELAEERQVLLTCDHFNLDFFKDQIQKKVSFNKIIQNEVILQILESIRSNNIFIIDEFDSVLVTYSNIPIFMHVNSSKIDLYKLEEYDPYRLLHSSERNPVERNKLIRKINNDYKPSREENLKRAFKQLKGNSFSINVNYHFNNSFYLEYFCLLFTCFFSLFFSIIRSN